MNKIDGLKFLQYYFPDISINSLFITNVSEELKEILREVRDSEDKFWRVRCASKSATELKLPMGSFYDEESVLRFMVMQKMKNLDWEFILHCIDDNYYYPAYTGTLAVENDSEQCDIVIELQKVTREMIDSMDQGKRPRDWDICVNLRYAFLHKSPVITKYQDINLEDVKGAVSQLFSVGTKIYTLYEQMKESTTSYTRFNIYGNGTIILNDHRSIESFIKQ